MLEKDWAYLRASLDELQEYILSDEVYWPFNRAFRKTTVLTFAILDAGSAASLRAPAAGCRMAAEQQQTLDNLCGVRGDVEETMAGALGSESDGISAIEPLAALFMGIDGRP